MTKRQQGSDVRVQNTLWLGCVSTHNNKFTWRP
jgi:hypothetical protein